MWLFLGQFFLNGELKLKVVRLKYYKSVTKYFGLIVVYIISKGKVTSVFMIGFI